MKHPRPFDWQATSTLPSLGNYFCYIDSKDEKASSSEKDQKVKASGPGSTDSAKDSEKGSGKDEDLPPTAEEFETDDDEDEKKEDGSEKDSDESKKEDESDQLAKGTIVYC